MQTAMSKQRSPVLLCGLENKLTPTQKIENKILTTLELRNETTSMIPSSQTYQEFPVITDAWLVPPYFKKYKISAIYRQGKGKQ
jgi:hypothetical protein